MNMMLTLKGNGSFQRSSFAHQLQSPQKVKQHAASFKAVLHAEKINKWNGHENLGFLSLEKGFMPVTPPLQSLPKEFSAWDELASSLHYHYKNQTLRTALKQLPVIVPTEDTLDPKYLCRASVLMSIFAHAYVRCERREDLNIPQAVLLPWKHITERLQRPVPFLSYIDLIVYNWKLKKSTEAFQVENLELLVPTVNNNEERVFYLTQAEILYKSSPIIEEIVHIQTAILHEEVDIVIKGLQKIQRVIEDITQHSFLKINPNPRSATYVDPVVWAKTVAPFAVPLQEGVQGPSGTSSPIFHLIDTFLERAQYDTILGREALFIRAWYPQHWRDFLTAVDKISLSVFVKKVDNSALNGAYYSLLESYAGKQGFLGVHKRKVYGYLQLAFKVGRSITIGGFSGIFKERTWEEVDDELENTRLERYQHKELKCPFATLTGRKPVSASAVQNVALSIERQGIQSRPGDRCAIIPSNNPQKVDELLANMSLPADTSIKINSHWQEHVYHYYNISSEYLPLRQILQMAKLTKLNLDNLHNTSLRDNHCLAGIQKSNLDLSLDGLLSILFAHGISTEIFKAGDLLTNILPLETERLYSISSLADDKKEKIELTVGKVPGGVASDFLHHTSIPSKIKIPFRIVRPLRFRLDTEKSRPVLMFAGGTGISPFKAFWEQLQAENRTSLGWLFLSIQDQQSLPYQRELEKLMLEENLSLDLIFSREAIKFNKNLSKQKAKFIFEKGKPLGIQGFLEQQPYRQKLYELLKPASMGGKEATVYVCGKAGYAKAVMNGISNIIKQEALADKVDAQELFLRLFSENRYMQDVFSGQEVPEEISKQYHISEIVERNNEKNGYWVIINNKVYDLTEFKATHPGGEKIVTDNAGRDATHEFRRAEHHLHPEVLSLLAMYYVGECKELEFEDANMLEKYQGWLKGMHLCTEMYNTLYTDYSFTNSKTTGEDDVEKISPYKAALIIENSMRFNAEYIPLLLETFLNQYDHDCGVHESMNRIRKACCENSELMKRMLYLNNRSSSDNLQDCLAMIEEKDKKLIHDIRNLFLAGLKYFENFNVELEANFEKNKKILLEMFIDKVDHYIGNTEMTTVIS